MILTLSTGFLLVSICSAVHIDNQPLYADPIPIPSGTSRAAAGAANETLKCASQQEIGAVCAPDCKTFMVCAGLPDNTPAYSSPCTSMDTNKPYCVGTTCTSTPNKTNSACQSGFTCTSVGTFPDPSDCSTFHYCSNTAATAKSFHCPDDYVFQLSTLTCVRKSYGYCYTIDCTKKENKWVLMPGNSGYYAFCGVFDTIMFKCEDDKNYHFDLSNNECTYNCKAVANYEDRTNCTNYISCNWINGAYKVSTIECPPTYKWDDNFKSCVPMGDTQCQPKIKPPAPVTPAPPPVTPAPPPVTPTPPPKGSHETGTDKPVTGGDKTAAGGDKPAGGGDKPAGGDTKPAGGDTKPAGGDTKPAGGDTPAQPAGH